MTVDSSRNRHNLGISLPLDANASREVKTFAFTLGALHTQSVWTNRCSDRFALVPLLTVVGEQEAPGMTQPADSIWAEGIRSVTEESGGAMSLVAIRLEDLPLLSSDAVRGDQHAHLVITALFNVVEKICSTPKRRPALCGCCPRALHKSASFAIALTLPLCADSKSAVGVGICAKCATDPATITTKAAAAFRRIWPNARLVTMSSHAPGHA